MHSSAIMLPSLNFAIVILIFEDLLNAKLSLKTLGKLGKS